MSATLFGRARHLLKVADEQGVTEDRFNGLIRSGMLSDVFDVENPEDLDRMTVRQALGLPIHEVTANPQTFTIEKPSGPDAVRKMVAELDGAGIQHITPGPYAAEFEHMCAPSPHVHLLLVQFPWAHKQVVAHQRASSGLNVWTREMVRPVLNELDFAPGNIFELLRYFHDNPDTTLPICALGSVAGDMAPVLCRDSQTGTALMLCSLKHPLVPETYYLVRPEPA